MNKCWIQPNNVACGKNICLIKRLIESTDGFLRPWKEIECFMSCRSFHLPSNSKRRSTTKAALLRLNTQSRVRVVSVNLVVCRSRASFRIFSGYLSAGERNALTMAQKLSSLLIAFDIEASFQLSFLACQFKMPSILTPNISLAL